MPLLIATRLVLGALFLGVLALPSVASAHSALLDSQPQAGERLDRPPAQVVLRFNENVQPAGTATQITGPQGRTPGDTKVTGNRVVVAWPQQFDGGAYTVSYRVVSADGHVVSDSLRFSIRADRTVDPPGSTLNQAPALPPQQTPTDSSASGSSTGWLWAVAGLVLMGLLLLIWRRRPQDEA